MPEITPSSDSWDKYWQGAGAAAAFTNGGVTHPSLFTFWKQIFSDAERSIRAPKIIDIASGNGAVIESALQVFGTKPHHISSLDVSPAAIENIQSRFPSVSGIVSDASSISQEPGSFDIVTSQFGVEYAGHDAIFEVAKLVAKGGRLALILHCQPGSIHQECQRSLSAIAQLKQCQFIPLAIDLFDAGFKAVGGAERSPYEAAAKALAPAISKLESIMNQYGKHVAGDTIIRLYNDVADIHQKIQNYDPEEVLSWLKNMDDELLAYSGRMASMTKSALANTDFSRAQERLKQEGFSIVKAEKLLVPGQNLPMAWILIADR